MICFRREIAKIEKSGNLDVSHRSLTVAARAGWGGPGQP
jgi:hypothetical protein